jgi:hypothetical protein
MGLSKSAIYYRNNPDARKVKSIYDKKHQKKRSAVKKRVECNKFNRNNGTYGNGDKMDCSHQPDGTLIKEHRNINRARK